MIRSLRLLSTLFIFATQTNHRKKGSMSNILLFLLLHGTVMGASSADEPPVQVLALAGHGSSTVLPCSARRAIPPNADLPTVEWSKRGLASPPYVFVYRQGFEVVEERNPVFQFRAHLFTEQLSTGNFSLRISELTHNDAGQYLCKTIWDKDTHDVQQVQLSVVSLPKPHLFVNRSDDGHLDVVCRIISCSPIKPHVMLLDHQGRAIPEQLLGTTEDGGECYREEKLARISARGVKNVTCRVQFDQFHHSKEKHMLTPEVPEESWTGPMIYIGIGALIGVLVGALIVLALGFLVHRLCRKPRGNEAPARRGSENTTFQMINETPDLLSSTPNSITAKTERKTGCVIPNYNGAANANQANDEHANDSTNADNADDNHAMANCNANASKANTNSNKNAQAIEANKADQNANTNSDNANAEADDANVKANDASAKVNNTKAKTNYLSAKGTNANANKTSNNNNVKVATCEINDSCKCAKFNKAPKLTDQSANANAKGFRRMSLTTPTLNRDNSFGNKRLSRSRSVSDSPLQPLMQSERKRHRSVSENVALLKEEVGENGTPDLSEKRKSYF